MLGVIPGSAAQSYGARIPRMGEFSVRALAATGNLIKASLEKITDQLSDLARHTQNVKPWMARKQARPAAPETRHGPAPNGGINDNLQERLPRSRL